MNLTGLETDIEDVVFKHIKQILNEFDLTGFYEKSNKHCISTSEVLQKILLQKGIKSHLVEVKIMIHHQVHPFNFYTIGYDGNDIKLGQVDSHVVLITETLVPYIIDASIQRLLPKNYKYVLSSTANNKGMKNIFMVNTQQVRIVYELKKGYDIPLLFQQDVFAKIISNQQIKEEINFLKKLNYLGICVSIFALLNVLFKALGIW